MQITAHGRTKGTYASVYFTPLPNTITPYHNSSSQRYLTNAPTRPTRLLNLTHDPENDPHAVLFDTNKPYTCSPYATETYDGRPCWTYQIKRRWLSRTDAGLTDSSGTRITESKTISEGETTTATRMHLDSHLPAPDDQHCAQHELALC